MHARFIVATITLLHSSLGVCADPSAWFKDLTRLDLKDEGIRIWYPAANATAIKTAPAYLKDFSDAGVYVTEPLLLDLGHGLPKLALSCDSGGSNDPSCRLLTKSDNPDSAIFESAGNDFAFLASGDIYVFGATDYTYDHRRLFRYDGKRFSEVAQPFRYVGVEGKTTAPLALTQARAAKNGEKQGANPTTITLDAGTPLTILLNAATGDDENGQNADYLVQTREGLIGWAHIPMRPDGTTIVEGFRYNGD
jgi:hypothetical protein